MYTKDLRNKIKAVEAPRKVKKNGKSCLFSLLLILVFNLFSLSANAQCAMCRAALTSEGNTTKAAAVNDGIVYLMAIPYILVAGIGYAVYRMKKNKSS
ncbi:hypothetical protein QLS91_03265 [Flavobacterium sp. LB2P84]|jgi:hypothetical protein|uniref:Adenylosuccinate synthetase n=1 Tax=Flavobacterium yafengii TaxID=3041253 RepID=A0AAW6TGZ6_9FLAO|nr:hypothetical protein [Flavobacterium yafengii]MDI5896773.1 hypothetical protein [Flavobacterium yafengii]MDI5948865.1 hypothetical protein [Flavobacterium yafengii]MDI6032082.1 hypothetical protein [Flavobacterium yafengii]